MRPTVRGAIHILRNHKGKTYSSNKYLGTAVLGTRVQTADTDIYKLSTDDLPSLKGTWAAAWSTGLVVRKLQAEPSRRSLPWLSSLIIVMRMILICSWRRIMIEEMEMMVEMSNTLKVKNHAFGDFQCQAPFYHHFYLD